MCILGVPYIRAGAEPEWYNLSYSISLKKLTLISLHQHRALRNLRRNKDIAITKPDKRNGVVILDRKLYNNAIEEIFSDTSKFGKRNEDPTLKREAPLQWYLHKL